MSDIIELKLWHYLILLLFAVYGLLQLVILPLVQKFIYRRFQATERALDDELDLGLPSYALANRRLWLDRLSNDVEVKETIKRVIEEGDIPAHKIHKKVKDYANEIVPSFNVLVYFRVGYWISRVSLRMFYWVKVGLLPLKKYANFSKDDCVVLVSNHRSNFDPMLLIYLTSQRAPISYSAGEWALTFPFRQILHSLGFYIVRRNRKDDQLYHILLKRYVFLATSQCVPQGLFLEGGLSRDGEMQPLKLGLLNYLIKAKGEGACKDIVFVPAVMNYDKVPELKTLIAHQDKGFAHKGRFYSLIAFLRFFATVTTYMMARRHKAFGYACVNFGSPVSLHKWQQEHDLDMATLNSDERRKAITEFGHDLADIIRTLIPVLPTNILAKVFQENNDIALSEIDMKVKATTLTKDLTAQGISVFLPENDEDYALSQGIYILLREKVIEPTGDGRFTLVEGSEKLLNYYCNTIPLGPHVSAVSGIS